MAAEEIRTVGARGNVVIPARVRKALGIAEGARVAFRAIPGGVVLRRARLVSDADEAIQDAYDVARIEKERRDPRRKLFPWSQVKQELATPSRSRRSRGAS